MQRRIEGLKTALRRAVLDHRAICGDLDCGSNMAAIIRPAAGVLAQKANALARELKTIDPNFPASWTDIPEGN